jgi:hypothetical protein
VLIDSPDRYARTSGDADWIIDGWRDSDWFDT